MTAVVRTVAFAGIEVLPVEVQVAIGNGLPSFTIVGLPDKAVAESRERVRAALTAIGLGLPPKRITINLAPADVQKEGSHFDLPIALGVLTAMGVVPLDEISGYVALGELGLDGSIAPVAGVLPAAIAANADERGLICPGPQGGEAAWAGSTGVLAPRTLLELINHFKGGGGVLAPPTPAAIPEAPNSPDLKDIKGQETAKRALEIAAAGGHNILMMGPPGSGKSMLAQRLPGLLPPMTAEESLQVSMIHSVAGHLAGGSIVRHRPFRDPHHSASMAALVGGGLRARPGEISLAHRGVLFLDELPEFNRQVLEALRQPLETGKAVVARANTHATYPARFQLVAAMNPCRCGYLSDPQLACSKAPKCAEDYQSKISGPMFDRIDLHIDVPAVDPLDMSAPPPKETSAVVAGRVAKAREIQIARYKAEGAAITCNAEADGELLEKVAGPDAEGRALLTQAAEKMRLSARGYHRILRVARTIADLEGAANVKRVHIAEALSYRRVMPGRGLN
ncbi:MAG: YifB family Mg chelatase-like AAA ATPase [Rhodospirillaceae bacterium]|nr:YifB family Mg chelatase-like AAA ATPase [Rhodospirillaceae bacterium]